MIACLPECKVMGSPPSHSCDQQCQVGLCNGHQPIQHDVLSHAYICLPWWWYWIQPEVPVWWEALQSAEAASKTKVQNDSMHDVLLTDDCALNAGNQYKMKESMDMFSVTCEDWPYNKQKEDQCHVPACSCCTYMEHAITVAGQKLAVAD